MFFKFCKTSLAVSTAFSLSTLASSNKAFAEPKPEDRPKRDRQRELQLAQLFAEHNKLPKSSARTLERPKRTPRDFFEKPVLESLSKVALYHLCGFIGYLPYVSTVASYLIIPLIPFNCATDGYFLYTYMQGANEVKIQDKKWTSKDLCKVADYMSYAFAFASAGGVARGVPAVVGMLLSMYIYARNTQEFNKTGAILSGAVGGTVPMVLLSFTLPFWIGKYKRIPFAIGIFATYATFSSLVYNLMEDYIEHKNEEKITSAFLSTYKWSYLSLLGLWTLCGSEIENS